MDAPLAAALALVVSGALTNAGESGGPRLTASALDTALVERIARLEGLLELHPQWSSSAESELSPKALLGRIELLEQELELHPPAQSAQAD